MKVALLHDYLIRFGGAERVLQSLSRIFPEAPIYTILSDSRVREQHFPQSDIRQTFLSGFPQFLRKRHRMLGPLLPVAVESIDLRDFDLVISSSSAFIKGVIVRPQTIHISYIHAPSRFLWDWSNEYLSLFPLAQQFLARFLIHYLRVWDRKAAERPDILVANSRVTQEKIRKYYRRESFVLYPPVYKNEVRHTISDIPEGVKDFFLIVTYLTPYKRVDLAVDAFNKLGLPLVVIGEGPIRKKLEEAARPHVTFLGWQPDSIVQAYYRNAKALIFPGEDDFGMTAVEAMSYGKPVLAYRKGGVLETVIEGVTGEFFDDPVAEVLTDGVRRLNEHYPLYRSEIIQKRAREFSETRFLDAFRSLINNVVREAKLK